MGIFVLIISFLLLIFTTIKYRSRIVNPLLLFMLLWTFILFLSNLNLYNINKPSNEAYFLLLLMIIYFFIGNLIANKGSNKEKKKARLKLKFIKKIRKKINEKQELIKKLLNISVYLLFGLLILFTLIDCLIVVDNLADGVAMSTIRRWRMGTYGVDINPILSRRSFVEELFRSIVLNPFETLVPPIAAFYFFHPQKPKKRFILLVLSLLVLILSSIAGGGGRLGFIYYFGSFFLAFLMYSDKTKFSGVDVKKYKKYVFAILIVGLVIVIMYTRFRTGAGNFIKQMYTYFALPPTLLSTWLPKLHEVNPTYGLLTTFGIHSYFFRAFETLGIDFLVPQIYNETFQQLLNAEIFKNVGHAAANAFVTPVYYFYIDGGWTFVCVASTFFGFIVNKFYKNFVENINIKTFIFYVLIMYGVFLSFIRIQTAIPSYIISFIMAYVLFYQFDKEK